jgi:hypothetical protein
MVKRMTADEILPLVVSLAPAERARLMRLLTENPDADEGEIYGAIPPRRDEFASDEDGLAWEAEGWEDVD